MPEVRIRAPFPAPGAVLTQLSGCVQATRGAVGGYRLAAGTAMPPLLLEDDEAVAVVVSLRTATGGAVEGLEETALRALTKLQQVLPPRLGRRVDALQSHTVSVSGHRRGPQVEGRLLALIAATARDREIMRFRYADHSDRAPSAGLSLTACDHRSRHPPPESLHSLQPDRTRSRRLRPSAVNPPPCAYRMHAAYRYMKHVSPVSPITSAESCGSTCSCDGEAPAVSQ